LLFSAFHLYHLYLDWRRNPYGKDQEPQNSRKKRYSMPTAFTPVHKSYDNALSSDYDISASQNVSSDWEKLLPLQRSLLTAIRQHQLGFVLDLQRKGVSLSFCENMPWREAVLSNNLLCVRYFLDKCGIDVNCEMGYGIRWSACKGHIDLVVEMFDRGVDASINNYEVLRIAKKAGQYMYRKIECYISGNRNRLSTEQKNQLLHLMREENLDELQRILENNPDFDWSASENFLLRTAVLMGWFSIVKFLIKKVRVDVNSESGFALRFASKLGNFEMVEYLLLQGAKANIRKGEAYRWALDKKHEEIANLLDKHNPEPKYLRHPDEFHLEEDPYRFCPEPKVRPKFSKVTPFTQKIMNELPPESSDDELTSQLFGSSLPTITSFPALKTPSNFSSTTGLEPWPTE